MQSTETISNILEVSTQAEILQNGSNRSYADTEEYSSYSSSDEQEAYNQNNQDVIITLPDTDDDTYESHSRYRQSHSGNTATRNDWLYPYYNRIKRTYEECKDPKLLREKLKSFQNEFSQRQAYTQNAKRTTIAPITTKSQTLCITSITTEKLRSLRKVSHQDMPIIKPENPKREF